jgi:hypothetical protein
LLFSAAEARTAPSGGASDAAAKSAGESPAAAAVASSAKDVVARAMSQVLGHHVSPFTTNTFWELGGTSLMAMTLDSALQAATGVRVGIAKMLQDGSVDGLAKFISEKVSFGTIETGSMDTGAILSAREVPGIRSYVFEVINLFYDNMPHTKWSMQIPNLPSECIQERLTKFFIMHELFRSRYLRVEKINFFFVSANVPQFEEYLIEDHELSIFEKVWRVEDFNKACEVAILRSTLSCYLVFSMTHNIYDNLSMNLYISNLRYLFFSEGDIKYGVRYRDHLLKVGLEFFDQVYSPTNHASWYEMPKKRKNTTHVREIEVHKRGKHVVGFESLRQVLQSVFVIGGFQTFCISFDQNTTSETGVIEGYNVLFQEAIVERKMILNPNLNSSEVVGKLFERSKPRNYPGPRINVTSASFRPTMRTPRVSPQTFESNDFVRTFTIDITIFESSIWLNVAAREDPEGLSFIAEHFLSSILQKECSQLSFELGTFHQQETTWSLRTKTDLRARFRTHLKERTREPAFSSSLENVSFSELGFFMRGLRSNFAKLNHTSCCVSIRQNSFYYFSTLMFLFETGTCCDLRPLKHDFEGLVLGVTENAAKTAQLHFFNVQIEPGAEPHSSNRLVSSPRSQRSFVLSNPGVGDFALSETDLAWCVSPECVDAMILEPFGFDISWILWSFGTEICIRNERRAVTLNLQEASLVSVESGAPVLAFAEGNIEFSVFLATKKYDWCINDGYRFKLETKQKGTYQKLKIVVEDP